MTNEEKLRITQDAFNSKLMSVSTWEDFKALISVITKTKVKNFIKVNLQKTEQNYTDAATSATNMAADVNNLITEVNDI